MGSPHKPEQPDDANNEIVVVTGCELVLSLYCGA